jgi:hypothetical protein
VRVRAKSVKLRVPTYNLARKRGVLSHAGSAGNAVENQVDFAVVVFVPLYIGSVGRYGAFVAGRHG